MNDMKLFYWSDVGKAEVSAGMRTPHHVINSQPLFPGCVVMFVEFLQPTLTLVLTGSL